jgi:hypothetical protein
MQNSPTGYRDLTHAVSSKLASLRTGTPEVMKAFNELGRAATAPGVLDQGADRAGTERGGALRSVHRLSCQGAAQAWRHAART